MPYDDLEHDSPMSLTAKLIAAVMVVATVLFLIALLAFLFGPAHA
jgi:hypothetical protein